MNDIMLERYLDKYGNMILRIALNQTKSHHDAEDITQQVFLDLFRLEKPPESEEHIKAWLIRATLNRCKTLFRSAAYSRNVSLAAVEDTLTEESDPYTKAIEKSDVYSAVMKLSLEHRTVIHLFYYNDMTVEQISAVTGVKPSSVKSRLSRARKELKQIIGRE